MKTKISNAIKAANLNKSNFVTYFEGANWYFKSTLKNTEKGKQQVAEVAKIAGIKLAPDNRILGI